MRYFSCSLTKGMIGVPKLNIRRMLLLCMVFALPACSLTGCGLSRDRMDPEASATENTTENTTASATEPMTETEEDTSKQKDITGASEEQGMEITSGAYDGNLYTNESLDLQVEIPEGWTFESTEELQQRYGFAKDFLAENSTINVEDYQAVILMDAYDEYGNSVNMMITNMNASGLIMPSEEDLLEHSMESLKGMLDNVYTDGYDINFGKAVIFGKEHSSIEIHGQMNGYQIYQEQVIWQYGNYLLSSTVACYDNDRTQEIFGFFSRINSDNTIEPLPIE